MNTEGFESYVFSFLTGEKFSNDYLFWSFVTVQQIIVIVNRNISDYLLEKEYISAILQRR